MNYTISHDIPGRIRFKFPGGGFSQEETAALCHSLAKNSFIHKVQPYRLSGSLAVNYEEGCREEVIEAVAALKRAELKDYELPVGEVPYNAYTDQYLNQLVYMIGKRVLTKLYMPSGLKAFWMMKGALPYVLKAVKRLWSREKLNVDVLDAAAISVSILKRDYDTSGSVMFFLSVGNLLEEWTHKKSRDDLAKGLALRVNSAWVRRNGQESLANLKDIAIGEQVVARMGSYIPVDGVVLQGEAMVNQSTMTGESLVQRRIPGDTVYAGTVIEEGELLIGVTALESETKLNQIIKLIDESEGLKAAVQSKIENMADAIVPYSFLIAGGVYLATRSVALASAALMVDYSCALKMTTPIAILTAMREGTQHGFVIKGGKFLEEAALVDTIVFDKTGTLTEAKPYVVDVIGFGGYRRDRVLRLAACLEEHFPHSVAAAVVAKANEKNLKHREMHANVEYIVAHGIASYVEDKRVVIGSGHFVFEDEKVEVTAAEQEVIDKKAEAYSLLFLAVGGRLAGMLCIEDPIRPEAAGIVGELKALGIHHIALLTGDSEKAAQAIARRIDADDYRSQVLPAEKADYINSLRRQDRRVMMLGDGINDSPALSSANVGIAMKNGADIARDIADVVLTQGNLKSIVALRRLSSLLIRRIENNFRFTVGFNSGLLTLGVLGIISPGSSALLHNLSTVATGVSSMRNYLPE